MVMQGKDALPGESAMHETKHSGIKNDGKVCCRGWQREYFMSNEKKYYLRGVLEVVVTLFVSGGIIQTFFAEIGFSNQQIGSYTALTNLIQVVVMVLSIFLADTTRNVKGTMALLNLSTVVFCGVMLLPCLDPQMDTDTIYWLVMALCTVRNLFAGFSGILFFRMLYIVADPKDFSRLESNNSILCGVFSIAVSGTVSLLSAWIDFRTIMTVGFFVSALFSIGVSLALNSLRPRSGFAPAQAKRFRPSILLRRDFRFFYLPNFLRGLGNGLMGLMVVVCLKAVSSDTVVVSGLTAISSVAAVVGAWLFGALRKKADTALLYAGCSLLMCLLLPLMVAGSSIPVFCSLYFIISCAYYSNNIAGALYPTEYVPYEDIGAYTSVRLIVMTLGQAVAGYIVPELLEVLPAMLLLALVGTAQLVSGLLFLCYDRRYVHSGSLFCITDPQRN